MLIQTKQKLIIMEIKPLIPIGAKIKVEKSKIRNDLPEKILHNLPKIINGEVVDYKMTDGMGIGYVFITDKKLKLWIFNNELYEQTKKEYQIDDSKDPKNTLTKLLISQINKVNYKIDGNRNIQHILNPINLIRWLIFTIKDIF